ncbi:MAG: hypothetical protein IT323_04685 [Anaerolineae bacterium]|nr:hypothetical protein [Anaerolineae bacterium]
MDEHDEQLDEKVELAELRAALDAALAQAQAAQVEAARVRVATRWRLPETLAARLRGANEAELDADARELSRALPKAGANGAGVGSVGVGNPAGRAPLTLDEVRRMTPAQINRRWDEIKPLLRGE